MVAPPDLRVEGGERVGRDRGEGGQEEKKDEPGNSRRVAGSHALGPGDDDRRVRVGDAVEKARLVQ